MKTIFKIAIPCLISLQVCYACWPDKSTNREAEETSRPPMDSAVQADAKDLKDNEPVCSYYPNIGEDSIEVTGYMKTYNQVIDEQNRFRFAIQYASSNCATSTCTLDTMPTKIKLVAIMDLFEKTKSFHANIRGLEVIFGLQDNTIVFYYKLAIMNVSSSDEDYYYYSLDSSQPTYKYIPGSDEFSLTDSEDHVADRINEYKLNLRIKHKDRRNYKSKTSQDPNSIIFSFQEIFYMVDGCFNCHPDNELLYFYNGASRYTGYGISYVNKHDVFITCEPVPGNSVKYALAANYAHLCPPSCNPYYIVLRKH